jgi:transposase
MRTPGSVEELTRRRVNAVHRVVVDKVSIGQAADEAGVHRNSVSTWIRLFRDGGEAALQVRTPPGRPSELDARQISDVVRQVLKGAKTCGFETDLWTLPRIAKLIEQRHGVCYDVDHLSRLARSWGLSWQKPRKRPIERDEQVVEQWVAVQWPRIKKKSAGSKHT